MTNIDEVTQALRERALIELQERFRVPENHDAHVREWLLPIKRDEEMWQQAWRERADHQAWTWLRLIAA